MNIMKFQWMSLAKLYYFTNLDFPEIREFPETSATFLGPRSCEVALILPECMSAIEWIFVRR